MAYIKRDREDRFKRCFNEIVENGLQEYGGQTLTSFLKRVEMSDSTYYKWMDTLPEFRDLVKKAKARFKEKLEVELVKSLANTALGYTWTQKIEEYAVNEAGEKVLKKRTIKDVHERPNVAAAIFLLTNIRPDIWKNRRTDEVDAAIDVQQITGVTVI